MSESRFGQRRRRHPKGRPLVGRSEIGEAAGNTERHVEEGVLQAELSMGSEQAVREKLGELPEHGRGAREAEDQESLQCEARATANDTGRHEREAAREKERDGHT